MVEADELGGHDTPDEQPQLGTGTAQEMVGAAAGQPMTANAVDRRTGTCAGAPTASNDAKLGQGTSGKSWRWASTASATL